MEKVMAHKVILDGKEYRLSILEIEDGGRQARVRPFVGEEAGTVFVNGTIEARRDARGICRVTKLKI